MGLHKPKEIEVLKDMILMIIDPQDESEYFENLHGASVKIGREKYELKLLKV